MTIHSLLFAGLLVGVSIAVPIGPMGLLCIQRTLASGFRSGVSTGMAAATMNVVYGALITLGLGWAAPLMAGGVRVLSFVGGLFLLWTAARTVLRQRGVADSAIGVLSPLRAYGSALLFNAMNPVSPMLIVALLAPIVGTTPLSVAGSGALLLGMFGAAAGWWVCLSAGVVLLRSRLTPHLLAVVNQLAAAVLTFYGALALARSIAP